MIRLERSTNGLEGSSVLTPGIRLSQCLEITPSVRLWLRAIATRAAVLLSRLLSGTPAIDTTTSITLISSLSRSTLLPHHTSYEQARESQAPGWTGLHTRNYHHPEVADLHGSPVCVPRGACRGDTP